MIKKYSLVLLAFLCSCLYSFGQVKISEVTFETAAGYSTTPAEFTDNDEDYFTRTDGSSNIAGTQMVFANTQGSYFFGAHDTNGDGGPNTLTLDILGVNISGYTNLEFRIHLAEDDDSTNQDWDGDSYVHITGTIDVGSPENLIWVEAAGGTNTEPRLDTNFNGIGNGTAITDTFTQFTQNITGTGNLLNIQIEFNDLNDGDEDIAIDNIEIWGVPSCSDAMDFANIQSPTASPQNINEGDTFNVFTQAVEPGITNANASAPGVGVEAWIGYSSTNDDPSTGAGWTWVAATYSSDVGANDVFVAEIGSGLAAGTYYYACRYRLNGCGFTYGGVGHPWNNDSVELIVTGTPVADVVITEIMYNTPTPGSDDEWIEICNISGSTQDISNYIINIGATSAFTFPASTTIVNGDCITISLGSNGDGTFNIACPFVPDYGIGASTNNTDNLVNNSNTITLYAADGSTISDQVQYDDNDNAATDGVGSSFHVIDATMNNSDTDTNWTNVIDGGSPGTNSLVSPCTAPELQLVDDSNTDQACGYTINFGSQATGFSTDITFDIDNDGSSDLDISSLNFSGANPGDFSIVSPGTPFTVTAGNTQVVTVRFSPTVNGNRTATLTINNNDSDESACTIDLQGIGTTPAPEINVEGDIGTFPDIADGDITPSGTDNTLFAAQFIGNSQEKSFRIQNIGTDVLNISSVTVIGTNPGDFTISIAPASSIAASGVTVFEVSFSPLAAGVREADIRIANNDSDEGTYTFRVRGTGNCVANAITISPTSGPEGTIVTVTGTNLNSATATFNGLAASVNNISATEMEVTVPSGATSGNLEINDDLGCPGSEPFTIIDTQIGTCEGGTALTELFISEVTDATYGSLTYIEIYNATGSNINLANYSIRIYANGNTLSFTSQMLSGTINAGDTYVVTTGTFGVLGNALCASPGGDGTYGDLISTTLAGVNVGNGDDDYIGLYNNGTLIDELGVFGDDDWTSSTILTGDRGYNFRRLNTATPLPTTPFNLNQWNVIDWAGSGSTTCVATNDYSDIGTYDFSTGTPATITVQPTAPTSDCDLTASLTVTAAEGFVGGNPLAYQWYFSAPGDSGWTAITNNATYSGATAATLDILNSLTLDGYQYYCQVREDDALCYQASIATQLSVNRTTWTTVWDNGAPDINTIAIIDGAYNTGVNGNINACQLIINSGANRTLNVDNSSFVRVVNNVINNGTLTVQTQGSFVQDGDGTSAGTFVNNGGTSSVNKSTDTFDSSISGNYNYTYWSSPVTNSNVITVFPNPYGNRRYYFAGENFLDATQETGNNNGTNAGQDDIDDNGDDWQNATSTMDIGRGYAVTAVGPPMPDVLYSDTANFIGDFNTGDVLVDIFKNDSEINDNNWNFIGNPYPSAISADEFLTENTFLAANPTAPIQGAIFLWSHGAPADVGNNGNEAWNFSQNDYAIINGVMGTAGGNGVSPDPYIPSGQGFFIAYDHSAAEIDANGDIKRNQVRFMNSMRETANNGQFFEALNDDTSEEERSADSNNTANEKLWLNLTSDNGVFSQIGIAYLENATNDYDGWYYDTPRNLSTNTFSILYSIIENNDKPFAIQGRDINDLNSEETIPLGFKTIIEDPTLYRFSLAQLEGAFFENNTIYLKDNLMSVIHDLSTSDYTFTSIIGEFNDRFEIVFTLDALSDNEFEVNHNALSIIENKNNGLVTFKLTGLHTMESIEIHDLLGRTVYTLDANGNSEKTFNLSKLSQATYIAKVTLDNGYVITKKAIKRK